MPRIIFGAQPYYEEKEEKFRFFAPNFMKLIYERKSISKQSSVPFRSNYLNFVKRLTNNEELYVNCVNFSSSAKYEIPMHYAALSIVTLQRKARHCR